MLALRELQRGFAAGMMSGDSGAVLSAIQGGTIAPEDRLRIYRNTMRAVLVSALRLTYPAVDALVGADFFDRAAGAFNQQHPPRAALLSLHGGGFPDFLAGYAPAATLPYLADVARLEWVVEQVAHKPPDDEAAPSAAISLPGIDVAFTPSLTLIDTDFPAESIWRAALNGDEAALAAIDPRPAPARLALWRNSDGVAVANLSRAAAAFVETLLIGGDVDSALAAAAETDPAGDPIAAITAEILSADFVRLTRIPT